VAAQRYTESQPLNGQSANHKRGARGRGGKQQKRCDGEKKSGWQHQQSGVFHGHPFQAYRVMQVRPPDRSPQLSCFIAEGNWLLAPFEHSKASSC
jgi:hypothetical protein